MYDCESAKCGHSIPLSAQRTAANICADIASADSKVKLAFRPCTHQAGAWKVAKSEILGFKKWAFTYGFPLCSGVLYHSGYRAALGCSAERSRSGSLPIPVLDIPARQQRVTCLCSQVIDHSCSPLLSPILKSTSPLSQIGESFADN